MKYRIWTSKTHHGFKLQRKRFLMWVWLDKMGAWCNWYGKTKPYIFSTYQETIDFIHSRTWSIKEIIIEE